ncbi:sugar phosphate isomerase/epimerase family protein [Anatilimnocola floriformis]|uniref:sugar phosphate isomerase/epimerase family protein n=1 Tax=Anatilimnocola floriformis TaxID=2948575 RepID=UPI0020C45A6F|nr:sugar phosphate isomerase/epimerase family protein [Anatilimnocola floriformis]
MNRLAVSEITTFRWSFEEDLLHYRQAGVSAIGVWRQKLEDFGEERGIELLKHHGWHVSSLQWAGGFTGSDGGTHNESIDDAMEAVRTAHALGASCLLLHSGSRGVHTHKHARRLLRTAIDQLIPLAEALQVTLALEPMPREAGTDWTFLHDWDETLSLINDVGSDYLRAVFDLYYWGHDEVTLARLPELAPKLALVQLADSHKPPQLEPNRCALGDGGIPLHAITEQLTAAGYRGCYEVELMGEEIEAMDYCDLLNRSQQEFQRLLT